MINLVLMGTDLPLRLRLYSGPREDGRHPSGPRPLPLRLCPSVCPMLPSWSTQVDYFTNDSVRGTSSPTGSRPPGHGASVPVLLEHSLPLPPTPSDSFERIEVTHLHHRLFSDLSIALAQYDV